MKKSQDKIIDAGILIGVVILLIFSSEPIIYPDSHRYLNGSLYDPPLYFSIIYLFVSIFGTLNSVVILQTLLIGFGVAFFVRTVSNQFDLTFYLKALIAIFLLIPILQFYRYLLTEPICYAFSLFFVSFVFKLIYNFSYQNLAWCTIFIISLLLTRNQFMFIYPVVLLLYMGILIVHKSKKVFSWLLISFTSIIIIHNAVNNLDRYINKDKVEYNNFSEKSAFFFIYVDSIYVSSSEDANLFESQNIQKTLTKIFEEMNKIKALQKYYNGRGHYALSLKEIRNYSKILFNDLAKQENIDVISLKKHISIKLIKTNSKEYIRHIFKKFYDSSWLFVFLPIFMLLASLPNFIKHKSHFSLITIFISLFTLANHSVIYLFGRVQPRYFIYTDFILLIFIFISFAVLLKNNKDLIYKNS